jgi:cobalt/nickel transport system permease protein
MAVSIALIIQALLFGDGGVTAIAANCFNMAFVMPFSGYYIYKILSSKSEVSSPRQVFAAGVAGYISLNLAAFFTALEFGIQPLIAHAPDGTPLYAPYPLSVAVPVMAFEHLILFGFIEAVVTGLVVAYVAKTDPLMLGLSSVAPMPVTTRTARSSRGLWAFIGIIVILTPLGLLASGTTWGEWSSDELQSLLGFVPEGLKRLGGIWRYSFMADYNLPGWDSPLMAAMGYILSALVGVGVIVFVTFIMSRFISADRKS